MFCFFDRGIKNNQAKMKLAWTLVFLVIFTCACASRYPRRQCSPRTITNLSPSPVVPDERDSTEREEIKLACIELTREIKNFAAEQLGLSPTASINLSEYEIENWPEFVPAHYRNWDRKALEELQAVLPSLLFRKRTSRRSTNFIDDNRKKSRRELLDRLVESFREQTGSNASRISWTQYNLIGWPAGVSLRFDRLTCAEVLAVWRHFDSIKFVPLGRGDEKRKVIYSDGTQEEFDRSKRRTRSECDSESEESGETYETCESGKVEEKEIQEKQIPQDNSIDGDFSLFEGEEFDLELAINSSSNQAGSADNIDYWGNLFDDYDLMVDFKVPKS